MVRTRVVAAVVHGHPHIPHAVPPLVLLEAVLAQALVALVALAGGAPRVLVAAVPLKKEKEKKSVSKGRASGSREGT